MPGGATKPSTAAEAEAWVRARFRLDGVREKQATVIMELLCGNRILFVAPTGHGKSLCYQALAASPWSKGVVLVFQPLKALMQEQAGRAGAMGLRAALVNSDQDEEEQRAVLDRATRGEVDVLFLSPERQGNALWMERVGGMEIKGVVIDEAHCISQWGHDFRPWYRRLVETMMAIGFRTPVLAVTATAPPAVVNDIVAQIGPDEPVSVERLGSYRPNLALRCVTVDGFAARLAVLLHHARTSRGTPGIAYLLTQDETEMAADFLQEEGIAVEAYHAGMEPERRAAAMQAWQSGQASVICATSALGMGLDRADVRWIAHAGLPDSLLRYVQEIGRAGRDGKSAEAIAIHDPGTRGTYEAFIRGSSPPPEDFRAVADLLRAGLHTRTEIVVGADIPEGVVQRILEEFVRRGWCEKGSDGKRAVYTWCGGVGSGVPDGLEAAIGVRCRFVEEAVRYADVEECRAVALARAMGDEHLPDPCGRCDRCAPEAAPDLEPLRTKALSYLAQACPPIPARNGVHLAGRALSRYGLGQTGEAVKRAKYQGASLPADLVNRALDCIRSTRGEYAGARFDAVVSIPSSTSTIVADFSRALAAALGVPWIELVKTRVTEQQKKFRSRQRKEQNIDGSLAVPDDQHFESVLLVDDVLDSGASLRAASSVLRPMRVYPLVLARAKHRDDT